MTILEKFLELLVTTGRDFSINRNPFYVSPIDGRGLKLIKKGNKLKFEGIEEIVTSFCPEYSETLLWFLCLFIGEDLDFSVFMLEEKAKVYITNEKGRAFLFIVQKNRITSKFYDKETEYDLNDIREEILSFIFEPETL